MDLLQQLDAGLATCYTTGLKWVMGCALLRKGKEELGVVMGLGCDRRRYPGYQPAQSVGLLGVTLRSSHLGGKA